MHHSQTCVWTLDARKRWQMHSSAEPYAMLESRVLYFFLLISNVKLHAKTPLNNSKYSVERIFFSFHFSVTLMWQLLKRFWLGNFEVIWTRPPVKLHLKLLCHFHLPILYWDTPIQPYVTQTNQKCTQDNQIFLCLCLKWLVWAPPKVKLHLKPLSFPPTQFVSWQPRSTICDSRAPLRAPN